LRWTALITIYGQEVQATEASAMRLADIDALTVRRVLDRQPVQFRTKHLSQDPEMLRRHALHVDDWSYNPMVGRFLSGFRDDLGLVLVDHRWHLDGALWEKVGRPAQPLVP
jgi:hypothetical protein